MSSIDENEFDSSHIMDSPSSADLPTAMDYPIEELEQADELSPLSPDSTEPEDVKDSKSLEKNSACSRIASSANVSSIPSFPEYDLNSSLLPLEIRQKLTEIVQTKGSDLLQACKNFDRRATNKISKTQLRQVLRMFCFPITAAQFDSLCEYAKLSSTGKINYQDFFLKISNLKQISDCKKSERISDNLPVDEVELRIKEKIKPRLRDVIRSFWLFDINKDGFIQKSELRRIIRNYCFDLSDNAYEELWKNYDPKGSSIIKYRDFLVKLGINTDRYEKYMPPENVASSLSWTDKKSKDKVDGISNEQKCKRAALENRDDPIIQGLPMEEVMIIFADRIQNREKLLKKTFKLFDYEKNGTVSLSDFRGVLNFFVMAMSANLFNRIIKRLEFVIPVNSDVNYKDFLRHFKSTNEYAKMCERKSEKLDCALVVQKIKNRILNPETRLRSVFTRISNTDSEWQITRPELKKAVEIGLNFKLSDEEYKELTNLLDPGSTNLIKCMDFLRLFEGPCESTCQGKAMDCVDSSGVLDVSEKPMDLKKYYDLTGEKLVSKLKHHVNKNISNIEKAILVCDPDQSGFIAPECLQNILSGYCFPLSNKQCQEIVSDLRLYGKDINYNDFFQKYKKKPEDDMKKWVATVDKLVTFKSRCPPELPVDESEEMLYDCVRARKTGMLKDFKSLDLCNVGVVCKDDVKTVFKKYAFRFNDKQFNELWKKFPRNQFDQLIYDQFFEEYSTKVQKPFDSPKTENNIKPENESGEEDLKSEAKVKVKLGNDSNQKEKNRKSAKEILYSKAPQLKNIFESIEPAIIRNFRTIRFNLRRADPKVTGIIDFKVLKSILAKSGIYFSKEDEFQILEYFDSHLAGKINYRDFLRIFVWYA
ncbi:EF-hand calcium-binding domain-containing protein 6-like [Uloborus diversus]|uniref:EF-hand calcium-binding domain-containing protein 6-like n=1 Tax=Uloborus diversus TaxID=327109 RepID=UPI00240A0561|nr:EF-hand calcium-binding domain-containing protein 6-like [Uloborus diversus]